MSDNPYSAPATTVDDLGESNGSIHDFPRFSAWGVFGLSVITLGIYSVYWMYTRSKIINSNDKLDSIPEGFMITAMVFTVVNLLGGFVEGVAVGMTEDAQTVIMIASISKILGLVTGIMNLVWIFKVKNRICTLAGISANGVMTFFFQALYVQYKINQAIDNTAR